MMDCSTKSKKSILVNFNPCFEKIFSNLFLLIVILDVLFFLKNLTLSKKSFSLSYLVAVISYVPGRK